MERRKNRANTTISGTLESKGPKEEMEDSTKWILGEDWFYLDIERRLSSEDADQIGDANSVTVEGKKMVRKRESCPLNYRAIGRKLGSIFPFQAGQRRGTGRTIFSGKRGNF